MVRGPALRGCHKGEKPTPNNQNGAQWVPIGPQWGPFGPQWVPLGPQWAPFGPQWAPMGPRSRKSTLIKISPRGALDPQSWATYSKAVLLLFGPGALSGAATPWPQGPWGSQGAHGEAIGPQGGRRALYSLGGP